MRNLEIKLAMTPERLAALEAVVRNAGLLVDVLDQVDTYFVAATGRLKLRETSRGGDEPAAELIAYRRPDETGPRWSDYELLPLPSAAGSRLKVMMADTIGVSVVVAKRRLVAIRDRSRIHLDRVDGLGCFLEIETVARDGDEAGIDRELAATLEWLGVEPAAEEPIRGSYADLRRNRARQGVEGDGFEDRNRAADRRDR
jgi:adenylate cyclase class IV